MDGPGPFDRCGRDAFAVVNLAFDGAHAALAMPLDPFDVAEVFEAERDFGLVTDEGLALDLVELRIGAVDVLALVREPIERVGGSP